MCLSLFLLILRSVTFDHSSQVYITYTQGLQDESLHSIHVITVGIFNLHRGWFFLHRGPPVNVLIQRTSHCFHVIPANDTKESVFGHQIFPRPPRRQNPEPLAPEASGLTTELPHLLILCPFGGANVQRKAWGTEYLTIFWR